ncbi:MAG: class I SAM-dependent methyltransferase [Pirellulales bacterium]|nr:class I SAM-dependent methyltransferase [Pirellulales bacterium]
MLPRTLEPEVMDTPEEARDYDAMDHAAVNTAFASDLLAAATQAGLLPADDSHTWLELLDLGTATAQIPIELCRRHPRVRVVAVDLAAHMLYLARSNVELAGLRDRIRLELADAKALSYGPHAFAAVMSNSIVHHIAEPKVVLAEAVRVVRPGGLVFMRDLLRPSSEEEVQRLVETYAAGANAHQQMMFANSLRAALSLEEVREMVRSLGFAASSVNQTSDRHWTWCCTVS